MFFWFTLAKLGHNIKEGLVHVALNEVNWTDLGPLSIALIVD